MNIRYNTDSETDLPHIYKHGVTEEEIEDILLNPDEDRAGRDNSAVVIGQTQSGHYLQVTYVGDSQPDSVFVITAYDLKEKPLPMTTTTERQTVKQNEFPLAAMKNVCKRLLIIT